MFPPVEKSTLLMSILLVLTMPGINYYWSRFEKKQFAKLEAPQIEKRMSATPYVTKRKTLAIRSVGAALGGLLGIFPILFIMLPLGKVWYLGQQANVEIVESTLISKKYKSEPPKFKVKAQIIENGKIKTGVMQTKTKPQGMMNIIWLEDKSNFDWKDDKLLTFYQNQPKDWREFYVFGAIGVFILTLFFLFLQPSINRFRMGQTRQAVGTVVVSSSLPTSRATYSFCLVRVINPKTNQDIILEAAFENGAGLFSYGESMNIGDRVYVFFSMDSQQVGISTNRKYALVND